MAEVTRILGTNKLGEVDIIENSSSGTNYFAKVPINRTYRSKTFMYSSEK